MIFGMKLRYYCMIIGMFFASNLVSQAPAFEQEQEVLLVRALIDAACQGDNEHAGLVMQQLLECRGKVSASTIFQGLAHTCAHIGALFNSSNKHHKENAICNVLGTVFAVAAEVAAKTDKKNQPNDQASDAIRSDDHFLDALCKKMCLWYATQARLKTSVSFGRGEKNCVRKKRFVSTTGKTGSVLSTRSACHRKG